jgi:uncharacterized membrane protein
LNGITVSPEFSTFFSENDLARLVNVSLGRRSVKVFFLLRVMVVGVFGAATGSPRIIFIQAVPAAMGLFAIWWTHRT